MQLTLATFFSMLDLYRFGFTAENGERYPRAFELASNVKARIERVGGKTVDNIPLNVCEVKGKDDTLECTLHSGVACTIAGEYEVQLTASCFFCKGQWMKQRCLLSLVFC